DKSSMAGGGKVKVLGNKQTASSCRITKSRERIVAELYCICSRQLVAQSYRPEAVNFLSAVEVKRTSPGEYAPFVCVLTRTGHTHLPNSPAAFTAAVMIGPGDTEPGSSFAFSGGRNPAALKAAAITALASRGRRPL